MLLAFANPTFSASRMTWASASAPAAASSDLSVLALSTTTTWSGRRLWELRPSRQRRSQSPAFQLTIRTATVTGPVQYSRFGRYERMLRYGVYCFESFKPIHYRQ